MSMTVTEAIEQFGPALIGMSCTFQARDPWPGGAAKILLPDEPSNAGYVLYLKRANILCGLRGYEIIDLMEPDE